MSQESKGDEGETKEGNLSLTECIRFPGRNGTVNIPQQIGPKYITFGMALLEDETGAGLTRFVLKHPKDVEAINMEILQEWITGRGKRPVTWKTLIDVLRDIKQDSLADEIEVVKYLRPEGEGNSTFCKVLTRIILVAALIVCMIATGVRIWIASPPDTAHLYIDRPTQGHHHYPVSKQSLRNLNMIEKGKQPSLSELHHLVIPGPKEVKVIRAAATKWKKLAIELGFDLSVIDSIGSRYSDSEEDCESMLRRWLMHQDATVSWEVLMTALDNIGLNSIAHDLRKATGIYWVPGTNVVALATVSIKRSTVLEWKEFGFALNITLVESDMCNVTIAASISGDFKIPSNTMLVSVVYYIQVATELYVPPLVECELEVWNSYGKDMRFGFAWKGPPYTFDLHTGDFTSRKLRGIIRIPNTPLLVAAFHSQSSGILETKYFARVFSQREGSTLWRLIVVVIPRLLAFEQIVTKYYPLTSKRKELANFYFEFETNKGEIILVPEDNISSESVKEDWTQKSDETVNKQCPQTSQREIFIRTTPVCQTLQNLSQEGGTRAKGNWKIVPVKVNKISRQEINKFHSMSYLLPTFEFMVLYLAESDELQQLGHKFILAGAKPPQNFFRIYLDPSSDGCNVILTKQDLLRELASIADWETLCENLLVPDAVLSTLRPMSLPNEMKKKRCLEAYLNTDNACWEQLVKVVADHPFYNEKLSKKIANKYIHP